MDTSNSEPTPPSGLSWCKTRRRRILSFTLSVLMILGITVREMQQGEGKSLLEDTSNSELSPPSDLSWCKARRRRILSYTLSVLMILGTTVRRMQQGEGKSLLDDNSKHLDTPPQPNKFIIFWRWILGFAVAVIIILAVIFFMTKCGQKPESTTERNTNEKMQKKNEEKSLMDSVSMALKMRLNDETNPEAKFITRNEWRAAPPAKSINLILPVDQVLISSTETEGCSSQVACINQTNSIQKLHMKSQDLSDIAYNFLVGGDGSIYEGRGWDLQADHVNDFNSQSISIAFIGNFEKTSPPQKQIFAAKSFIEQGIELKKILPGYRLYSVKQFATSDRVPDMLQRLIETWPHWTAKIPR